MAQRVPYHHPEDEQYSLVYVTRDRDEIDDSDDTIVERYELEGPVFVCYANQGPTGTVEDIDRDWTDALEALPHDDRILTLRYLQIFEGIVDANATRDGGELEIYKEIDVEGIPDAISRVDWDGTAVSVAGQLMSTLILKHPLPNANHRTAISMAQWYLESADPAFSLPELGTDDDDWRQWVDEYIVASKRLLTVRRNTTAFSLLHQWGCETVVRKGGVEIQLANYELDLPQSAALAEYAEEHTALCTEFVEESVRRADAEQLLERAGTTKAAFVDYLEETA